MIKLLLSSALFVLLSASSNSTKVFICDSDKATSYHYAKDCRGLNACKHEIVSSTKTEAMERGLKLCGWED